MRVISGNKKSLPLKAPSGMKTRPTTDRIKETLFNILMPYLNDSYFLDLFAGSGQMGIEALSRGSRRAVFVDNDNDAISTINANLKSTGLIDKSEVRKEKVSEFLNTYSGQKFDIIFIDPPYHEKLEDSIFFSLRNSAACDNNTLIILEADVMLDTGFLKAHGFSCFRVKDYKTNKHLFIRKEV
jgi:16S rRNA (guanine966-N2)-methyltransferase